MRVLSWNVQRAKANDEVWDILSALDVDICFLQEVSSIPEYILNKYNWVEKTPINKDLNPQKFKCVTLVKGKILEEVSLKFSNDCIKGIHTHFQNNIFCMKCQIQDEVIHLYNVYSPAWAVPESLFEWNEVAHIKLRNNDELWVTEIVYDSIRKTFTDKDNILMGGDFNQSLTFDIKRDRGNGEIHSRFNALGLYDTLSSYNGELVPTFKNSKGGKVVHQLDYLYASKKLSKKLLSSSVLSDMKIFENSLSDHLPIVSVFS